jgi:hypothetical protein
MPQEFSIKERESLVASIENETNSKPSLKDSSKAKVLKFADRWRAKAKTGKTVTVSAENHPLRSRNEEERIQEFAKEHQKRRSSLMKQEEARRLECSFAGVSEEAKDTEPSSPKKRSSLMKRISFSSVSEEEEKGTEPSSPKLPPVPEARGQQNSVGNNSNKKGSIDMGHRLNFEFVGTSQHNQSKAPPMNFAGFLCAYKKESPMNLSGNPETHNVPEVTSRAANPYAVAKIITASDDLGEFPSATPLGLDAAVRYPLSPPVSPTSPRYPHRQVEVGERAGLWLSARRS